MRTAGGGSDDLDTSPKSVFKASSASIPDPEPGGGIAIAVTGAVAIESAEDTSYPVTPHRSGTATPNVIAMPKAPAITYYIVTSAPSLTIPEEAIDLEQGWIPSNVTLRFRVVDSPESEAQFLNELEWHLQHESRHLVFDMR